MDIERIRYDFPSLCFKIVTLHMDPERSYRDIHLHAAIEIICVDDGSIECCVHDETMLLKKGEAVEFGAMSEVLFAWSKKWIENTK